MRIPGMAGGIDPRRAALMQALQQNDAPTPALRAQDSMEMEGTLPMSEEDMVFSGMYDDGPMPPDMGMQDQANLQMQQEMLPQGSSPEMFGEAPTPQPGTPEFYDWLMNRVG